MCARPVLSRFDIRVFKDNAPPSDLSQVPAAGAFIDFYKQGATVSAPATVPVTVGEPDPIATDVNVYDAGTLAVTNLLQVDLNASQRLIVADVVSPTLIRVLNLTLQPISLLVGNRLLKTNDRPVAYSDPVGTLSLGSQIATLSDGRAPTAYLSQPRFDYVISGITPARMYLDAHAGARPSPGGPGWLNVRDFASVQAAINALNQTVGGTIYLPAGTYVLTTGLTVNAPNVTFMGDGTETVLKPSTPNQFHLVTVNAERFRAYNLKLDGAATAVGMNGKACLLINGPARHCYLENVVITGAPWFGLWLKGVESFTAINCEILSHKFHGARIEKVGAATGPVRFVGCALSTNDALGVEATDVVGLAFLGCTFDGNKMIGASASQGMGIDATSCDALEVLACYFEKRAADPAIEQIVRLDKCSAAVVDGSYFQGGAALKPTRAVWFFDCKWARFTSNVATNMTTEMVLFGDKCEDCVEFCNRDTEFAIPRIGFHSGAKRIVGLSRRTLGGPQFHADVTTLPTTTAQVQKGSLAWLASDLDGQNLKVWTGNPPGTLADWKTVPYQ